MGEFVALKAQLPELHKVNPALMSYNVEFAEVTGGTFWKAYTPEQIAGTEPFVMDPVSSMAELQKKLMQVYPPINLYDEKLRALAKQFGTQWVRVSGTWATKTYYDFDGETGGVVPEGYLNVLTREQWVGVLDFVKAIGAKLLVSVSACSGVYGKDEAPVPPWPTHEAEKLFKFSADYGVPIDASEFVNEPNILEDTGFPKGYTAADHARDQKIFVDWLKANYPDCLYVGPCTLGEVDIASITGKGVGGIEQLFEMCSTPELMGDEGTKLDVFSYHFYNGVSERLEASFPDGHWQPEEATSEEYLACALEAAKTYGEMRDRYCPGGEMWVTEAGDAGGGGNTWAATFLDVFRTLNEAGSFSEFTDGVLFHNTLASSAYGYLEPETFEPRPNYFAVKLWTDLMGDAALETGETVREGVHLYAHSRADGKPGVAYVLINNSRTEATSVELPAPAEQYLLQGEGGNIRATRLTCNGEPVWIDGNYQVTGLAPVSVEGTVEVPPASCAFFVL